MPQVFKFGPYTVYFWSNEGNPQEPIHVHVSIGEPDANGLKIWITENGHCFPDNPRGNRQISKKALKDILPVIEAESDYIVEKWFDHFGSGTFKL